MAPQARMTWKFVNCFIGKINEYVRLDKVSKYNMLHGVTGKNASEMSVEQTHKISWFRRSPGLLHLD